MFRTPWFISQNLAHLKTVIETRSLRYPTDIGSLRRAYETLFTNDDIFAFVYKLVVHRKWELWHPSAGAQFVRSDNPVVVSVQKAGGLTVLYPISPERCFVAGPEPADSNPQIVPGRRQLNEAQTDAAIRVIAETGQKTVIARPDRQDAHLRKVLESSLGRRWVRASRFRLLLPGYWGELLR
jgi:hypothetical protein